MPSATPKESLLADVAYQELRQRILHMRLMPGQSILEQEIAAELGISRTPVREAIARLRLEGLVQTLSRKRTIVTPLVVDDMAEIYELMEGMEGMAVKLATLRMSEADLDALEATVVEQEEALRRGSITDWVTSDTEFHELIAHGSGNERLLNWIKTVDGLLYRARIYTAPLRQTPWRGTAENRAVVEAMRLRDAEQARALHLAHRARAGRELTEILRSVPFGTLASTKAMKLKASAGEARSRTEAS